MAKVGIEKVELGKWKKNARRRGVFVRRALSMTTANMHRIAERAGSFPSNVQVINRKDKIRSRELVLASAAEVHLGQKKPGLERKNSYSAEKKQRILSENNGIVMAIASSWWKDPAIVKGFGKFGDFVEKINRLIYENLNYFDAERLGKNGKPVSIKTWIAQGTKLFCRRLYFEEKKRQEREKALETQKPRVAARDWLYLSARRVFKKLGLNPETIATDGVKDVTDELKKIVADTRTGLTERQKKVILLRLEGKPLREIAKRLGLNAKSTIYALERNAIAKIKKRLEKI